MEDDGNLPRPDRDAQLFDVQGDGGHVGSVTSPNSTLEILVDGSELLNGGLGSECIELSITFEKTHPGEGQQNELADRLDGVEVRVSLDGPQAVGFQVVSSHHDDELLRPGDLQLGLEGPGRDLFVLSTDANTHTSALIGSNDMEHLDVIGNCPSTLHAVEPGNEIMESDHVVEKCEEENGSQVSEKKRCREDMAEEGRCLKLKTIEVQEKELEDPLKSAAGYVKPNQSQHLELQLIESSKLNLELETNELEGEITSDNMIPTSPPQSVVMDGTVNEVKEACGGQGMDVKQCSNGSTELGPLHSVVDNTNNDESGRARPRKRRKIAMLLAYCGAGYQGMQKNPGAVTIEGLLEAALSKAGAMPENYDGNPRKVDWMRAARTDKGVSAVGQVVSGLFYIDPPGFVERINAHLPKQIRLLGYKRVTPTFSAKKFCDRRRYEYVIPIFALDPSTHRDREAVLASEGKEDAFVKCQECSERGRKIPVTKVFHKPSPDRAETGICDGQSAASTSPSTCGTATDFATISSAAGQSHPDANFAEAEPSAILEVDDSALPEEEGVKQGSLPEPKREPFHFGVAERAKLNHILGHYLGTHNFHNFTSRVKAEDPSAKRYIVSFEAGDVFTVGNMEFVRCKVVGQSFMLHQIRKMIGLAIAVFRGFTPESVMETALRRDTNVIIPTAPELGLFLDECMYPAYNQKWYNTHEEVSQKGHEQEINCFKHDVIYEHIAMTENKEGQMALFLHSLNDRNYADLASAREAAVKLVSS